MIAISSIVISSTHFKTYTGRMFGSYNLKAFGRFFCAIRYLSVRLDIVFTLFFKSSTSERTHRGSISTYARINNDLDIISLEVYNKI